jgi:hypothetical protein
MKLPLSSHFFLVIFSLGLRCFAGTPYSNLDYGFTVTIPDGYISNDKALEAMRSMKWDESNPNQKSVKESLGIIIAAFLRTDTQAQIYFLNSFGGKQIGNEPLPVSQLPKGASVERGLASKKWTPIQAALMSFSCCMFSKATGER